MHCQQKECSAFSYTEVDRRCNIYSGFIFEGTDDDMSNSTMFFSKTPVLGSCQEAPHGSPSGIYTITTEGKSLALFCDMDTADGPWIVLQRRINGDIDFYRNWADYKNGFGDLLGNFWIGNDNLHLLTNSSVILRVELEAWSGVKGHAQYSRFQVANENQNYRLSVQGFSGDVDRKSFHVFKWV
ncbi:angiopoietin-4-like [Pecten maximus]|uniref:angiopoietin-4-like n=1 Tax=Pecten maximus TaxID=6579 RepID=UPI00145897C1|nr:angiopoietin-4-like [Pecten maximus]